MVESWRLLHAGRNAANDVATIVATRPERIMRLPNQPFAQFLQSRICHYILHLWHIRALMIKTLERKPFDYPAQLARCQPGFMRYRAVAI